MSSSIKVICCAAVAAAVFACRKDSSAVTSSSFTGSNDVTGSYFAADSGRNLGKNWCYSAALVLDSTNHFGSVIRMCSDDGSGPVTESIKGTYTTRSTTVRTEDGGRVRKLSVILSQDGSRRKRHTLVYENGALRFDEPWWMGAGLRALEIGDPTLKRISSAAPADSAPVSKASSTAPSTTTKPAEKSTGGK